MKIEPTGNKGYLLSATTKEVGTIYFALRVVEDLFPETDSAPLAGELAKTIRDRANGTDEEVHKPDYSYESDMMMKRAHKISYYDVEDGTIRTDRTDRTGYCKWKEPK